MAQLTEEALQIALLDGQAQAAREHVCRTIAAALETRGRASWGFGLFSDEPAREAIALAAQFAGELAKGAVALFDQSNWYAGAALVRQLIEVEYLAYLFATDPDEPEHWRKSLRADLLKVYQPAAMRKRSGGRFRDSEYWTHCDIGGHPSPNSLARTLLPEHDVYRPEHTAEMKGMLWGDLGQHLEELWGYLAAAAEMHGCGHMISSTDISAMFEEWHRKDLCADRVSAGSLRATSVWGTVSGALAPKHNEEGK